MAAPHDTGAHAANDKRRGSLLWLWLLLGALLLGLAIWAIAAALDDDTEELGAGSPVESVEEEVIEDEVVEDEPEVIEETEMVEETEMAEETEAVEETETAGTDAPAAAGAVLVGDVDLLTDDVDPTTLVGQTVQAEGVEVTELVADEAFYVGPEAGSTVLVRLVEFAGEGAAESPVTVEAGNTVSFTGMLAEVDQAFLDELLLYDPSTELETGAVYVQIEELSGVN